MDETGTRRFVRNQRIYSQGFTSICPIQVEKIQKAVSNLAEFASLGRQVPEFPHLPYREVLVGNYRVIYREEEKRVLVMSVVHGRRLLKELSNYG